MSEISALLERLVQDEPPPPARGTHTPGPWAICTEPPNAMWSPGSTVYSRSYGKRVAETELLNSECEANARLIAAAPDLLAAIVNSDDAHWTPAMRAAIAKATRAEPA